MTSSLHLKQIKAHFTGLSFVHRIVEVTKMQISEAISIHDRMYREIQNELELFRWHDLSSDRYSEVYEIVKYIETTVTPKQRRARRKF